MRGEGNDRQVCAARIVPDLASRAPAILQWQVHVHQHDVRQLAEGGADSLFAVNGQQYLEALAHQAPRQHVAVHLVVLDQQDALHDATPAPVSARTPVIE